MQPDQTPELPDELKDFVKELASFEAYSATVNHDQLMFQAGQAAARTELLAGALSIRRTLRIWQTAALVLFASSLSLGTSLALRPERQTAPLITKSVGPQMAPEESSDRVINQPSANEKRGTQNSDRFDSGTPTSPAIDGLPNRFALVNWMNDVISSPESTHSTTQENRALVNQSSHTLTLSHRSLLNGEQSRNLINRLIEEPNL